MKETILIIGNNDSCTNHIESQLSNAIYDVISSDSLQIIESLLREEDIRLIILRENFLDTLTILREWGYNQPVVAMYQEYNETFLLHAFEEGVYDCISTLMNSKIFIARIKNILRIANYEFEVIKYKDLTFMPNNNNFFVKGNFVKLTKLEKMLLLEFFKNTNKILSRNILLEHVWEEHFDVQIKTVNVAVKRLRDKINYYIDDNYIKSIHGQGYMFS
jgi:DNA-binding response OmpR family regulator